jgi:hypothetical protein
VQQRRRRRLGPVGLEPADQLRRRSQLRGLRALVAVGPAAHLALEEALGPAERFETDAGGIDGVEVCERVDHDLGELAVRLRVAAPAEHLGHVAAYHDTVAPLHHQEVSADHLGIVAEQVGAWGLWESAPQPRERAVLAPHVVRALGDRPQRRPAQHVLALGRAFAEREQVGEVRVAAAELAHLQRGVGTLETVAQILRDARLIEALVASDIDRVGCGLGHRRAAYHAFRPGAALPPAPTMRTSGGCASASKPRIRE